MSGRARGCADEWCTPGSRHPGGLSGFTTGLSVVISLDAIHCMGRVYLFLVGSWSLWSMLVMSWRMYRTARTYHVLRMTMLMSRRVPNKQRFPLPGFHPYLALIPATSTATPPKLCNDTSLLPPTIHPQWVHFPVLLPHPPPPEGVTLTRIWVPVFFTLLLTLIHIILSLLLIDTTLLQRRS